MINKDEQPLVSILMTSYNRENYIGEAIESVISSSYQNWELIISDDNSVDSTLKIAYSFAKKDNRIKVFKNEKNLGDYPNRNKAASYASGKYLKYLDSDDQIYYYGLEVMVNYIESFPDAGFALAATVDERGPFPICLNPREIYLEGFSKLNHFGRAPGSSIIKRSVFEKLGGFSGKRLVGDSEFWFKCARYYPMVKFPYDLYWPRTHENSESFSIYAKKEYKILRKEILDEALSHPDCPLNTNELNKVRKHLKWEKHKNMFLNISAKFLNFVKNKNIG